MTNLDYTAATDRQPREGRGRRLVRDGYCTTVGLADAVLFLTPEYNHSIPAVLRNAIDTLFVSFAPRNKAAAFVAYSMAASDALTVLLEDLQWWARVLRGARDSSLPPAVFRLNSGLAHRAAS